MTSEQLKHNQPIDLEKALQMAFDAGCSYAIASHKDFVQIHEPRDGVVSSLAKRVKAHNKESK
jgi:hypothetical protein